MKASEATRREPVTIPADATITDAAALMDTTGVGAVVVVDRNRPVGIVTDRDLVVRALARRGAPDGRIDSVMSTDLITLDAGASLERAYEIFRANAIRRLPIVKSGHMVGMITVDDLLIDAVGNLGDLVRPITGETVFAHREPGMMATT